MNRDDYRAKQKHFRELNKARGSFFWISKLPDREILGKKDKSIQNKGKTYRKGDKQ